MRLHAPLKFFLVLAILPTLAVATGLGDRSIPVPANPHNNPWLNFPATYGAGSRQDHTADIPPEAISRAERFMALPLAERAARAAQAEQQALDRGGVLFRSPRLGTLGLNCQSCHPNGDSSGGVIGVGKAELAIPALKGVALRYPRFNAATGRVITQTEMQNNCIAMFMKGERLPAASAEAAELTLFVSRFH